MKPTKITGLFIILATLGIVGYDFLALELWGVQATISDVIRKIGEEWPLFPPLLAFAMGALYGHFFLR